MKVDTLIIGAGISGLSYAVNCDEDFLIVEKEKEVGGLCRTFYEKNYVWDYAGHFFHFANPEIKNFFEKEISDDDMVKCKKNTNINYNNLLIDYPFQTNIHQLPKNEFIDCLYDLFNKEKKENYNSFCEMLYGKFGTSITEKFLKPYNEKLYACDLNELDSDAMGRFFPYADIKDIINNMKRQDIDTYNSYFDYPKKGAQYFIEILTKQIDSSKIKLDSEIIKIDLFGKKAYLEGGEIIQYQKLINTMPLNRFVEIIESDQLEIAKENLTANKVLVFNVGFDKNAIDKEVHWTYFPDRMINFYRVGYYSNILGQDKLSIYVEIGFKEDDVINEENELEKTIDNLKKCGIITDHKIVSYNSLIINPGYVHISKQSKETVKKLKEYLANMNVYITGRYGEWTYCSIEDCIINAQKLCKK